MTTDTYTAREIITDALRELNVVAEDEAATPDQIYYGLRTLNRMLKAWQNKGYNLFAYADMSHAITVGATQTLTPVRPIRLHSVNFKRNGVEMPMQSMTREEYKTLPIKTTAGTPTTYYYDRQREAARLYIWPTLSAVNGETLEISYERELADQDYDITPDVPGEWWDALVLSLADRMSVHYQAESRNLKMMAMQALQDALGGDTEGSVFFMEPGYAG